MITNTNYQCSEHY